MLICTLQMKYTDESSYISFPLTSSWKACNNNKEQGGGVCKKVHVEAIGTNVRMSTQIWTGLKTFDLNLDRQTRTSLVCLFFLLLLFFRVHQTLPHNFLRTSVSLAVMINPELQRLLRSMPCSSKSLVLILLLRNLHGAGATWATCNSSTLLLNKTLVLISL